MADGAYESVVKETFETKPLRTVLMIDDEFPTFADLARGETEGTKKRFKGKARAAALYESFQKRHMICDVENVASDVRTDRFRKSDLIILDYHLGPGVNDSDKSIEILRELSGSKHFNTVVVYTAESDLDKVWLDIISSLSGGWSTLPAGLQGDAQHHWERLSDEGELPAASTNAMMSYAKKRAIRDLPNAVREAAQKELVDLNVPPKECGKLIEAMIHQALATRSGKYGLAPKREAVGDWQDNKRWIQSGNAFITILKKADLTDDEADPAGIMLCLSDALLAWKPNFIQIIISEIQNILELEALATEDEHLRDPVTQTALSYYLLDVLGPIDPTGIPDLTVPLMALVDKIVDGMRRRLSSDHNLLSLAGKALLGELRDTGWTKTTWPKAGDSSMHRAATKIARTEELTTPPNTMFRLNSFLSTEQFQRAHVTTGTVFYHAKTDEFFVAASPACDLVARVPGEDQAWARSIFPIAPLVAILLKPESVDAALAEAARGLHIFVENGTVQKAFKIVQGAGGQPSYEFFMMKNEGRVRKQDDKTVFDATRLVIKIIETESSAKKCDTEQAWTGDSFEVVNQLKRMNATRVLQLTGQHLSRIGLDFISMPTT